MPCMKRFPGPNSVLVLDTASIHCKWEITAIMEAMGCMALFLPPYSPQFNPIESLFSKYKQWFQTNRDLVPMQPAADSICMALGTVSRDNCISWIDMIPFYT
jgi:transposase